MIQFFYKIKSKKNLVLAVFAYVASLFTIWIGVNEIPAHVKYILAGVSTLFLLTVIFVNLFDICKIRIYKIEDEKNIASYLSKLYDSSGDFIISTTGGMKWVKHHCIMDKLKKKASQNNLMILIPKKNEITNILEKEGARVIDYEKSGFKPSSNFSIIRPNNPDSMIAIGRQSGEHHIIEEFRDNDTIMLVVNDVQKLLRKISDN